MNLLHTLIYIISITFSIGLGLFVFLKDRKEKINRIFFLLVISISSWLISLVLFYNTQSSVVVLWLGRINWATVLFILYYFLDFSISFPREIILKKKKLRNFLALWSIIFAILIIFTPLVDKMEVIVAPGNIDTTFGPLFFLYIFHYIVFISLSIFVLFYKLRNTKEIIERYQIIYILTGLAIAFIFGFITNIIFPFFNIFNTSNYGALSPIIGASFLTLAIMRYHLFEIKVVLTEILVLFTGFTFLIQALTAPILSLKILGLILLILFSFFGYQLIRSVIREIQLRAALELAYGELKKLDDAKSEFVAIASHQLRTPLTAIKGYVSMMLEKDYGEIPDKMSQPLTNVYASNERLINLVGDILNISKIEAGKMEMEWEKASLEEMILDIMNELKVKADAKKLYLKYEKPLKESKLPTGQAATPIPDIMIDKTKMRQVIMNFIDNSIKYTEKGGTTIRLKIKDSRLQIIVSDTGMGIDKEYIGRLFQSFSRANVGAKTHPEGTGLGLYIARRYIEMHKGRVWVESEGKGKGSAFFIELPVK